MKPNPFSSLNHFTVPVGIYSSWVCAATAEANEPTTRALTLIHWDLVPALRAGKVARAGAGGGTVPPLRRGFPFGTALLLTSVGALATASAATAATQISAAPGRGEIPFTASTDVSGEVTGHSGGNRASRRRVRPRSGGGPVAPSVT